MMLLAKKNSCKHVTSAIAQYFTLPIFCQAIRKTFLNISCIGGAVYLNFKVKATISMMKVDPMLSLPQAMWMVKYSENECRDRTIQAYDVGMRSVCLVWALLGHRRC